MNAKETVIAYHERTKHHSGRYAASLGYMDWATQPDPFRYYEGARRIALPLADEPSPSYHMLFEKTAFPSLPLSLQTLSQLLRYSLGLAAWKSIGADRWALRCNASSGNLHPTEATVILPPMEGISTRSVVAHYAPKEHALEILAEFDTDFWKSLPRGSMLLGLSSILWREAWKYGERAFRYCQLDAGHARRAVEISAKMGFWKTQRIDTLGASGLDKILGLDQNTRYLTEEKESADMLLLLSPTSPKTFDITALLDDLPLAYDGKANRLSPSHHRWEAIESVEEVTHTDPVPAPRAEQAEPRREQGMTAKEVILTRRSAQAMDFGRAVISKEDFLTLMRSVKGSLEGTLPAADLVLFVHHVEGLDSGLYTLLRNPEHREPLKASTRGDFVWQEIEPGLYLLEAGDFTNQSKFISCNQDIAGDGAFSLGMLCEFEPQIEEYGVHRYKELYWECGAIGQQLYLEATHLKLSATGIGCFLDDVMHRLLGLKGNRFQVLYHFTVGRAITDMRLTTEPPYK